MNMSGFNAGEHDQNSGRQVPASIQLPEIIKERANELFRQAVDRIDTEIFTGDHDPSMVAFDRSPRVPFSCGEVDSIQLDMMMGESDLSTVGVHLFSDGSPYAFEEDLDAPSLDKANLYDIVALREEALPYFASSRYSAFDSPYSTAYLDLVRRGNVPHPHRLDESACQQLMEIVLDPVLIEWVDLDEIKLNYDATDGLMNSGF